MKKKLRFLKNIWVLNLVRRIYIASTYFNKKYYQILKWGIKSNEDTNFTYDLTESNLIYLAQAVALITNSSYRDIWEYFKEVESNKELQNHIIQMTSASKEVKFADKEAKFGRRLGWYAFVRATKPKVVVETGVDKGLGAVLLCSALEKNKQDGFEGKYYGLDINPKAGYLLTGTYSQYGHIIYGDSLNSLSGFTEKIDLFINDSDHSASYEYEEYKKIQNLLNDNSIILGDNAHCTDKLARFSLETNRHFIFFKEEPLNHWYPGAGIGISFVKNHPYS